MPWLTNRQTRLFDFFKGQSWPNTLCRGIDTVEHAEQAGVEIPTNCTGTRGAYGNTLFGDVPLPMELPPGLDDYLVEEA